MTKSADLLGFEPPSEQTVSIFCSERELITAIVSGIPAFFA